MAELNLTGQEDLVDDIWDMLIVLNQAMLTSGRKEIWQKIDFEKRKTWINSDKDPVMNMLYNLYKKLYKNYFGPSFYSQKEFE